MQIYMKLLPNSRDCCSLSYQLIQTWSDYVDIVYPTTTWKGRATVVKQVSMLSRIVHDTNTLS